MLFFYPKDLEIIGRRIYYTHPSGILKRNATEKITFKNTSERILPEIILEVEKFKPNLKIIDNDGNELIYLPNYKIEEEGNVPKDILNAMNEKDLGKKRYILLIKLNQPVKKDEYYSIHLDYEAKEIDRKYFIFTEKERIDWISFYDKETLSIFCQWEDGLTIERGGLATYSDDSVLLDNERIHLDFRKNFFSFSVSNKYRTDENITSIGIFYRIKTEEGLAGLMYSLMVFVILFPFTDIIWLILHNISYLFDSLEIESVFILTLAFAQTRTKLLSHEKWIKLALIIAGIFFVSSILLLMIIR